MKVIVDPDGVLEGNHKRAIMNGVCQRCGAINGVRLYKEDTYICTECESFGRLTSRDYLLENPRDVSFHEVVFSLEYPLTKEQNQVSKRLVEAVNHHEKVYIQAVCGAGKTEMVFSCIQTALTQKKRVAFVIPRKQVVIEITKRLKEVFPSTTVKAIYASSKDDRGGEILVLTIQQLISYRNEFDVMIVDEFDAFPIVNQPFYQRLINQSLMKPSTLILMSATITQSMIQDYHLFDFIQLKVFSRYHHVPLDIPKMIPTFFINSLIEKTSIPRTIKKEINSWIEQKFYFFIYVPTIKIGYSVLKTCIQEGYKTAFVHSKEEAIKEHLKAFKTRKYDFLLTTTILERGITYENLHVMVFFSDHSVFSKETLIQISGRVGRKIKYPTGNIFLYSRTKSRAMIQAIQEIKSYRRINDEM